MAGRRDGARQRVRLTLRKNGTHVYRIDCLEREVNGVLDREGADLMRLDRLKKRGRPSAA